MKWEYWCSLLLERHCPARGLRSSTISSYRVTLEQFKVWAQVKLGKSIEPDEIKAKDILEYVKYLRDERGNGDSCVNVRVVTLRTFYRAMVAMEQLEHRKNPTHYLPKIRAVKQKFQDTLSHEEVKRLLNRPCTQTILGLRDRAILTLLYGTGIRASECAHLKESDVDLKNKSVRVFGKGGYQRVVPLNDTVLSALESYRVVRGKATSDQPFFRTRKKKGTSRGIIYDRVKRFARLSRIAKRVTPHVLRHTFATHLVRMGEKLIVLRDLLGHKQLTSTQIYLHMTGEDLRNAVDRHPVGKLLDSLGKFLPDQKVRFQHLPGKRFALNN
ncbi:MAG: tyrosine-type recombinase/integrase [Bdellovibrionota bacterium]